MLFTEIDHVAIAVRDLEAAIAYYHDTFGCTVEHREVVESDGVEEALLMVAESYVQHNPNVPTWRAAFVDFFSKLVKRKPIEPRIKAPLVAIAAEGDLVVLSFVREAADPKDPTKKYTTT